MIARRKEHVSRVGPKAGDAEAVGLPAGDGVEAPEGLTADGADRLIRSHREEWGKLPPTLGQENYLRRRDLWKNGLSRGEAARMIGKLKSWPDGY